MTWTFVFRLNQTTWISGLLQLLVVAYWHASISELQQLSLESNTSLMYSHLTSWQGKIVHNFFRKVYVWCTHYIVPVGRGGPGCPRTIQQMNGSDCIEVWFPLCILGGPSGTVHYHRVVQCTTCTIVSDYLKQVSNAMIMLRNVCGDVWRGTRFLSLAQI